MKDRRDPMEVAREKVHQIDPATLRNLQNIATQYSREPMTPESFVQFANSVDDRTLNILAQQLGVKIDRQMLRSLTPEKVQQLMRLFQENK